MNTKKENKPHGLLIPLITPFYKGVLDVRSMKKLIKSVDSFVDGFIPCLSSGEGYKLSLSDWTKVVNIVISSTKKPTFAGILRKDEKDVLVLIKKANTLPVAGVVIPTLYSSDAKNLRYIEKVCKLSKKSVILYNTENYTFNNISSFKKIDSFDKIIAIKDSSSDSKIFKTLITLKKKGDISFSIFQGMEDMLLQSVGCDGYALSLLNVDPSICKKMYRNPNKINNSIILKKFKDYELRGDWVTSIKTILHERGLIRSSEEIS